MPVDVTRLLQAASRGLAAGDQEIEDPTGIDLDRLFAATRSVTGSKGRAVVAEKDLGVGSAFSAGLKSGIIDPFRLLGAESEEVTLDETSERVANFLGSLVGLGISFIPFAAGTGIALRGIGLTRNLARAGSQVRALTETLSIAQKAGSATEVAAAAVSLNEAVRAQALFGFVRNTIAGAAQFGGAAESLEEVPRNLALGVAFGAGIESLFLAKAMKSRRGVIGQGKLFNDGSPVADIPVDIDHMAREVAGSPSVNNTAEQTATVVRSTFFEDNSAHEVVMDLIGEHVETVRSTGLSKEGVVDVLAYAKETRPNAQRLTRRTSAGIHEVLIHEPFDPANVLTKKQIGEWKATGFASGEELIYAGRQVEATGGITKPGFVSVRSPLSAGTKEGIPFLAPIGEVTRPVTTRFFNKSAGRNGTLQQVVASIESKIGFNISTGVGLAARRGFVDVSEFAEARSFKEFADQFTDRLASVQGVSTPEEAVGILAKEAGIPGLRIVDDGIPGRVFMFDQKRIGFVDEAPRVAKNVSGVRPIGRPVVEIVEDVIPEPVVVSGTPTEIPNLGLVIDNAVLSSNGELQSFIPSWRNSISAPLREAGYPQKEIDQFLDLYAVNQSRRLDALLDPEFAAIKNASELQFGGCP